MCTSIVNALQDFDVNGTKQTSTFQLHYPDLLVACRDTGPLPFCLIPPASRLQSMCSSTLETYFDSLLQNRDGITLEDLPIVWDSLRESTQSSWIDVGTGQYVDQETYYGLQPCPTFNSLAASGASKVLMGIANGQCFMSNAATGFMEVQATATGANDTYQRVGISQSGNRGYVLFRNALYFWQGGNFQNVSQLNMEYYWASLQELSNVVQIVVVGRDVANGLCVCFYFESTNDSNVFLQTSRAQFVVNVSESIAWCCLSTNFGVLVAVGAITQSNYQIRSMALPSVVWTNVPWAEDSVLPLGAWDSMCRESNTQVWITTNNKQQNRAQIVQLSKQIMIGGAAMFVPGSVQSVNASIDNKFFAFIADSTMYVCHPGDLVATPISIIGIPYLQWQASLSFAADTKKLWYMSTNDTGSQLFSNHIESKMEFKTQFVSDFDLKLNVDMHVSDFGSPILPTQPKTTWFFGLRIVSHAQAGFDYYSPHEYFRVRIDPGIVASVDQFPHVVTTLQRANFDLIARGNQVRLFDNSQTEIIPFNNMPGLLSRNTNNSWGEYTTLDTMHFSTVAYLDETTRNISPNGLYIFYTPPAEFGVGPRVVMNVFNSAAFAMFCEKGETNAIAKQRLSKAIEQQSLFCWQHLFTENEFLDERCACIVGKRLVDELYPSLAENGQPWNSSRARINQNFPCLSRTCQRAIAQPETTNVYNVTQQKCQNADLTMCISSVNLLDDASKVSIRFGSIVQQCNGSIGLQCSQDENCPLGSVCVNGRCAINCKNNNECAPGSSCIHGTCLFPNAANSATESSVKAKRVAQITLGVLAAVVLVLLILLIVILVKHKKKAKSFQ